MQPEFGITLRDKKFVKLAAELLVPGDIVKISVGDKVPADIRMYKLESPIFSVE